MRACDVLIVGGGPAGSTCAWRLARAGLDVVVVDRATFPRDKVCGGWITPQVVADLELDTVDYQSGRTFQPITGFRTGTIGGEREIETSYGRIVSYGIRRREFDEYLLRRAQQAGVTVVPGTPIDVVRRDGSRWVLNGDFAAPMLVGAGGHFCPVARHINTADDPSPEPPLVVAREIEFVVRPEWSHSFTTDPESPELYFCRDLRGYGWCFRKQGYVNIGFGRADRRSLPRATDEFVAFLQHRGTIPELGDIRWHGHAYLLNDAVHRRVVDAGVVLAGDAAGLAYPQSGEGIRPAVESGLLAALTIVEAAGRYTADRLQPYEVRLRARLGGGVRGRSMASFLPSWVLTPLAGALLGSRGFVRHVTLDRWFLHAQVPPLAIERPAPGQRSC